MDDTAGVERTPSNAVTASVVSYHETYILYACTAKPESNGKLLV